MRQTIYAVAITIATGLASCDIANNEVEPGVSFTKIYDDQSYGVEYDPLALVSTEDGGYLGLAAVDNWNAYLFKTDLDGNFVWEIRIDDAYVSPLAELILIDGEYHLFCMNEVTLATVAMRINLAERTATPIAELNEVQYPLAITKTNDESLLVLGYDRKSRSSTLHAFRTDFSIVWSNQYAVEEDVEEDIIHHISRTGKQLPFLVGTMQDGQSYFFNGYANYTLGLNFVQLQNGDLVGAMNGFRDEGFISAVHHLQGNQFALARSSFGVNSLIPNAEVNPTAITASSELVANDFPEIDRGARVVVHEVMHKGQPVIVFGTHTNKRQLVLFAYDKISGELRGVQYLGQSSPYQLGDFVGTDDGGLAVLSETFLVGRFSRPCLFKLSAEEVDNFFQ